MLHADGPLDGAKLMATARSLGRSSVWPVAAVVAVLAVAAPASVAPQTTAAASGQPQPAEQAYTTADGYSVGVQVSAAYPPDPARAQSVVDMLGGLLHGPELGRLHISLVTPAEAASTCGSSSALACYSGNRLVLPAEQPPGGPPVAFLLAHEYAHHILAYRRNDPWPASGWGPKRWATRLHVCEMARHHELFLGYASVPGEAFAETYASMHLPALHMPWGYTDLLAPDDVAEAAARADVTQPWTGPTTRIYRGRIRASVPRTVPVAFPLDGTARISVTGGPRTAFELTAGGRVLARARPRGAVARTTFTVCGQRHATVRLESDRGSGAYALSVTRP